MKTLDNLEIERLMSLVDYFSTEENIGDAILSSEPGVYQFSFEELVFEARVSVDGDILITYGGGSAVGDESVDEHDTIIISIMEAIMINLGERSEMAMPRGVMSQDGHSVMFCSLDALTDDQIRKLAEAHKDWEIWKDEYTNFVYLKLEGHVPDVKGLLIGEVIEDKESIMLVLVPYGPLTKNKIVFAKERAEASIYYYSHLVEMLNFGMSGTGSITFNSESGNVT